VFSRLGRPVRLLHHHLGRARGIHGLCQKRQRITEPIWWYRHARSHSAERRRLGKQTLCQLSYSRSGGGGRGPRGENLPVEPGDGPGRRDTMPGSWPLSEPVADCSRTNSRSCHSTGREALAGSAHGHGGRVLSDGEWALVEHLFAPVWRPPGASRVSSRTQTSTTRCAAAGRRGRVLGSRGGVGRAATGTPSGQPPRARLQALPHARP
jgi:hypothetical protein